MSSITEVMSWTDLLEEESLYICSCDADLSKCSLSTTFSSSPSSVLGTGSSEVTEFEEWPFLTTSTPCLTGAGRVENPSERIALLEESRSFMGFDILSEKWVKKPYEKANTGHVGTPLGRVKKKPGTSTRRLSERSDVSALMQAKLMRGEPAKVCVELYPSKGTDHGSIHARDNFKELNLPQPKLQTSVFLKDGISELSVSPHDTKRLMSKQKIDQIAHSAIRNDGVFVLQSEAFKRSRDEYCQGGMKLSHSPKRMNRMKESGKELANPFEKSADLLTNACASHALNPTSARATELTRDYEIIIRESGHEPKRHFVCLVDTKQSVAMENPLNEKKENNPKSVLNKNRDLHKACPHSVELEKNHEGNTLDAIHLIYQKKPFTDNITTCPENPVEVPSQANRGFLKFSHYSEPLEGEFQPNSTIENSFNAFEVVSATKILDGAPKCPSRVGKGTSKNRVDGHSRGTYCTIIEISDDSAAFLPELPVENIRLLPPDQAHFRSRSAEIEAGDTCAADTLKVYKNFTQVSECIISYQSSDVADSRGWRPSICSISNTEKHLIETCAEFSHDLGGIHINVTEPQGIDVVAQTHLVTSSEASECLRVLQPFCAVEARCFPESEIYRWCVVEAPMPPGSCDLSGLFQGGDTVREGVIEMSSEIQCQNVVTASHPAEMGQCALRESKKCQKSPKCSFHRTSRGSDGFGDVEDGLKGNSRSFTKSYYTCQVLDTSSSLDNVQASLHGNDENSDSKKTQVENPKNIQIADSAGGYAVALPCRVGELGELLETASPITELMEAFKVEKYTVLPTALEFSKNLSRVCQNVLIVEEVMEIGDLWGEKLQTNPTIAPLSLADIHSKPDNYINQMVIHFFNATVDTTCCWDLKVAVASLFMTQGKFWEEDEKARSKPQNLFPELVRVIPLQEMPAFVNNYELLHGVQEKPQNTSKTNDIKSLAFISTNTRDGLTDFTKSETTTPFVVDSDPPTQNAAETQKRLDCLEAHFFNLEHPAAAKASMRDPNIKDSYFPLCWRTAQLTRRQKHCQLNSMKIVSKNESKYILPHDRYMEPKLKKRRQIPSATFNNPSEWEANICGERVQPLVLMGGYEPDSARTVATHANENLGCIHSTFHTRQNQGLDCTKHETVPTRQRLRKVAVRTTSPSAEQGPKTRNSCKNPLDLLILDTISSISEHNTMDSNGDAWPDIRPLMQGERYKGLAPSWWKRYGLNS